MTNKDFLRTQGNEKLLPLAVDGDVLAESVLLERGNTVEDGMVTRVTTGDKIYGHPDIKPRDSVTVQNGAITKVNGNPYP